MQMISRELCGIAGCLSDSYRLLRFNPVLTVVVVVIHVAVSLLLIALILLHSGRGGGLSDMFGGAMGSAAAGSTVVERNLDRITVATAVFFAFTTTILAIRLQ